MRKLGHASPGHAISAEAWNTLAQEVYRLSRMTAEYPLELNNVSSNPSIRFIQAELWAQLVKPSSSSSSAPLPNRPWDWVEVLPQGDGTWSIPASGRNGSGTQNPAYDVDNAAQAGAIVRLYPGLNAEYLFSNCCGNSINSSLISSPSSSSSSVASSVASSGSSVASSGSVSSLSSDVSSGSISSVVSSGSIGSISSLSSVASSGSLSSPSISSLSSVCTCPAGTITVQIVTDVQCVNGQLVVTKAQLCLPSCVTVC